MDTKLGCDSVNHFFSFIRSFFIRKNSSSVIIPCSREIHTFSRADGRYQVSNFAIAISNSSKLCPTDNCEFDLDGGEMFGDLDLVYLDGKLRVNTANSTKIMDLYASWQTIEERQQDGEPVQVLEGTLDVGNDPMNREYQSQTNGTIVSDGEDIILEAHGTTGSPLDT